MANSGENNYASKLKKTEVLEILDSFYNKNITRKEINRKYNVSYVVICGIIGGRMWKVVYREFMLKQKT